MKRHWLIFGGLSILCSLFAFRSEAQDAHHTQFFNTALYLNPALTGATPHYRFTALYRNQWATLPDYQMGFASFDYNFDLYKIGAGLTASYDRNSSTGLSNMMINASGAYAIQIRKTMQLRLGLQLGYYSRSMNFNNLTFADQLATGGATAEKLGEATANALNVSAGAIIFTQKLWLGLSAFNIARPNLSVLGSEDRLPMRFTAQLGAKLPLKRFGDEVFLMPSLQYQMQGGFNQAIVGTNLLIEMVALGVWYRGFPLSSPSNNYMNQDALAGYAGIHIKNVLIGYSYDFTLSQLRGGGSHEITLTIAPKQPHAEEQQTQV